MERGVKRRFDRKRRTPQLATKCYPERRAASGSDEQRPEVMYSNNDLCRNECVVCCRVGEKVTRTCATYWDRLQGGQRNLGTAIKREWVGPILYIFGPMDVCHWCHGFDLICPHLRPTFYSPNHDRNPGVMLHTHTHTHTHTHKPELRPSPLLRSVMFVLIYLFLYVTLIFGVHITASP